jgi:uncharacterized protein YifN (PemK superfamily)
MQMPEICSIDGAIPPNLPLNRNLTVRESSLNGNHMVIAEHP